MADDRPADSDLAAVVAEMRATYDDQISTLLARASRCPTGTVLSGFWRVAPPDTVFLQGQALSRTTYAVLWQWVQDQGLVGFGFGAGDGSTTFTVPDCRSRAMTGADTVRPIGTLFGATTRTLTVANLPAHNHNGTTAADNPSHTHGGRTGVDTPGHAHYTGGNHGGHRPAQAPGVGGQGAAWPTTAESFSGDAGWSGGANAAHGHDFGTGNASNAHFHAYTTSSVGSGDPINVETPAISVSYIIYT